MKQLKVISLFSGYGTQELALDYCGINYRNIANCDILKTANIVYDALHKTEIGNLGDVSKVDEKKFPECDLLTYSFPCQDISISGIQRGIRKGTRSGLLYEVERIVEHNKPKYLLMENVKRLVSEKHMGSFQEFIDKLESLGYGNSWRVLNGVDFGCPQNRERVFMVSVLGESSESVREKLYSVDKVTMAEGRTNPMRPYLEENVSESFFINPPYTVNTPKANSVCRLVARRDDIKYDQTRRIYSIDGASPCLTTSGSPQIMLDDKRIRTLTAREGYRFMGVRDTDIDKILNNTNLSDRSHISLAGNSICVPVMVAIFNNFFGEYKGNNYNPLEISDVSPEVESDEDFWKI
jgi:DNA (cytosine-5)-methyltransferase 1